jgi:flagellar basal body-associated protein FliL
MDKENKKEGEAAEAAGAENVSEKKRGGMKWVIIGVVVLVLGAGGFAAWKFLLSGGEDPDAAATSGKNEPLAPPGPIIALDSFLAENHREPGN